MTRRTLTMELKGKRVARIRALDERHTRVTQHTAIRATPFVLNKVRRNKDVSRGKGFPKRFGVAL